MGEREMLTKEKASKVYETSGYFLAQVLAETPVTLVLPVCFFSIFWPLGGLPAMVLVQTFGVIALNILVCSGLSNLISAVFMDQDRAVSAGIVVMVFAMSAGGY